MRSTNKFNTENRRHHRKTTIVLAIARLAHITYLTQNYFSRMYNISHEKTQLIQLFRIIAFGSLHNYQLRQN